MKKPKVEVVCGYQVEGRRRHEKEWRKRTNAVLSESAARGLLAATLRHFAYGRMVRVTIVVVTEVL